MASPDYVTPKTELNPQAIDASKVLKKAGMTEQADIHLDTEIKRASEKSEEEVEQSLETLTKEIRESIEILNGLASLIDEPKEGFGRDYIFENVRGAARGLHAMAQRAQILTERKISSDEKFDVTIDNSIARAQKKLEQSE